MTLHPRRALDVSFPLPLGEGWPKARVRAVRTLFIEKAQPR